MPETISNERGISASVRHLRLFESVGRLSSFRRASEECHLSQPAVTQAIAKLEEQLAVSLFERGAGGTTLSRDGEILHLRVTRLLHQLEEALEELGIDGGRLAVTGAANRITPSQIRGLNFIIESSEKKPEIESGQLSRAGQTRAARHLEENLRRRLFTRSANGMRATPDAAEFSKKLNLAFRELDWALEELEAARGRFESKIVIGALPIAGSILLGSVLQEFMTEFPDVSIRVVSSDAQDMQRNLRLGNLDFFIGLLKGATAPDLREEPLAATPYMVVARPGHPLTQKKNVTLHDIASYDWVIGTPGATRRACFETLFAQGPRPRHPIETSARPVIRRVVNGGDRLALLTTYELFGQNQWFEAVPFGPIEPVPFIGVTSRSNWLPTPIHESFLRLFRERISGFLGTPMSQAISR